MGSDMAGKWRVLGYWSISPFGKRENKKWMGIVEKGGQKFYPQKTKRLKDQ
jgi:hypothetical protein